MPRKGPSKQQALACESYALLTELPQQALSLCGNNERDPVSFFSPSSLFWPLVPALPSVRGCFSSPTPYSTLDTLDSL